MCAPKDRRGVTSAESPALPPSPESFPQNRARSAVTRHPCLCPNQSSRPEGAGVLGLEKAQRARDPWVGLGSLEPPVPSGSRRSSCLKNLLDLEVWGSPYPLLHPREGGGSGGAGESHRVCCVADGRGCERRAEGSVRQPRQHHGQLPEGEDAPPLPPGLPQHLGGCERIAARAGSMSTPAASSRLRCDQRLLHSCLASAQEIALQPEPPVS